VIAASVGMIVLIAIAALILRSIQLCCDPWNSQAREAQRKYVITDTDHDVFCATEGMVRIENHEWKPFDREAA
jgi:hypothetical protein